MITKQIANLHIVTAALILAMIIWASSLISLKYTFMAFDPMIVIF